MPVDFNPAMLNQQPLMTADDQGPVASPAPWTQQIAMPASSGNGRGGPLWAYLSDGSAVPVQADPAPWARTVVMPDGQPATIPAAPSAPAPVALPPGPVAALPPAQAQAAAAGAPPPPLANAATKRAWDQVRISAGLAPWQRNVVLPSGTPGPDPTTGAGPAPWETSVQMPDTDMTPASTQRTDFTQDIDGAFSQRNAGSKHWSEVARSGNGDMTTDLEVEDDKDITVLDGLGEQLECLSYAESTRVDGLGAMANIPKFRWPKPGEMPPYAPTPGKAWIRQKTVTASRQPGGARLAKVKWALASKGKINQLARAGQLPTPGVSGLGAFSMEGVGISLGVGVAGGIALWLVLKNMRKGKK